eukprot:3540757-Rhodomonas_salina.1
MSGTDIRVGSLAAMCRTGIGTDTAMCSTGIGSCYAMCCTDTDSLLRHARYCRTLSIRGVRY